MTEESYKCYWCTEVHDKDLMCAKARIVLDKMREKGASYDAPTIELPGLDDTEIEGTLCLAIGVRAFYTETLGVFRPGLAIQPVLLDESLGKPLILIDEDVAIRRAGRLFDDMAGTAVRRARKARDEAIRTGSR